uniref:Uncharacterized protein n=1 Tax=Anguilla anguilla TaxID=7936 RepID=A0A0E9UUD5_ANGAN
MVFPVPQVGGPLVTRISRSGSRPSLSGCRRRGCTHRGRPPNPGPRVQ